MNIKSLMLREEYRTGEADLVQEFYSPCLLQSVKYYRSVGYFRSSVFLLVGPDLIKFAKRGGKIRLICSPNLTEHDIEAISKGYQTREQCIASALQKDIEELLSSQEVVKNAEALATLISVGALEIKLAFLNSGQGIYHEKLGLFLDDSGHCVSFKGSVNETWNGWAARGNYEAFDVFCSWLDGRDQRQVKRNQKYFDSLWYGRSEELRVVNFPNVAKDQLKSVSKETLGDIDTDDLSDYFDIGTRHYKHAPIVSGSSSQKRTPFPHQFAAIEAWKAQNKKGIFEHATGSGKTFTALTILQEHLGDDGVALILVPDRLLHRQWEQEIKEEIEGVIILKAGDGNNQWRTKNLLRQFTRYGSGYGARVVLATMPTARTRDFISRISSGSHLLVIADEVHEIGSSENSKCLTIESGSRLGLSATPRRYGDPAGTQRILDYFGGIVQPPYSLKDAINQKRLVEYEYHPEPIHLSVDESEQWEDETRKISLEYARSKRDNDGIPIPSKYLQNLLIQRSRIAKKAAAKVPYAIKMIEENYVKGESWLIYCEDQFQLKQVMENLTAAGYRPCEYHTSMEGDSGASLEWFKRFGGIMVAIRCLDQGVDIPKISHAIILASSQNPRQFIQRRGRVLRVSPGKCKAVIYDAVVVPLSLELEPGQLSLLKSELQRSIQFSSTAMNRSGSNKLLTIAIELGIDPEELGLMETDGIEEDSKDD